MSQAIRIAERYRSLLEVNRIARSNLTTQGVFQAMCAVLRKLVPYDRAGLSLYDPDHDGLKLVGIYGPHEGSVYRLGHLFTRKGSQTGWVFEHQKAMVRRDVEKEFRFPADKDMVDEGYHSLCSVPLIVRGNSIGVVSIVARKNQLLPDHAEVVEEMSNQIALTISCITLTCLIHTNTRLVCPRCIGAAGGKTTVSKHREALSNWGKKGGRGRKNLDLS
jgi:formate hydrogenlyase transcriptional activator